MPTVIEIIRRLLPRGTNGDSLGLKSSNRWEQYPVWPPDAFAVTALLVSQSGLYCDPRYINGCLEDFFFSSERRRQIEAVSQQWGWFQECKNRDSVDVGGIAILKSCWRTILRSGNSNLDAMSKRCQDACLTMMMLADAACSGVGFVQESGERPIADYVLAAHEMFSSDHPSRLLPYLPQSLCRMVPKEEACVQPKTMTAQVGCTLRSLSHHLALLPPSTEVETWWLFGVNKEDYDAKAGKALNLLLVPFPYHIDGNCFIPGPHCFGGEVGPYDSRKKELGRFFEIDQRWLRNGNRALSSATLGKFLLELIAKAEEEVGDVNGLVLPELALDDKRAIGIAAILGRRKRQLEIFISGIAASDGRNAVKTFLFKRGTHGGEREILSYWEQSKHHRWRLDSAQIRRYSLGDQLEPEGNWWESANIHGRGCCFYVFREGMTLATLICEDLARIDPVQTVIRSIGPNLVVALLMDGPQLERRWSGRYATVLADDPGSAVLTLTSLGLLRRSVPPGKLQPRQIALWKGGEGVAEELEIPPGQHGLLITLSRYSETNYTIDGRSDEGQTYKLRLSGQRGVKHPCPPKWATVD